MGAMVGINMGRRNDKTIVTHTLNLVRSHYDDELSFTQATRELSDFFSQCGDDSLSEYVSAQIPTNQCTMSTMEVDPLSKIARDLYEFVESECGADNPQVIDFRIRLSMHFDDMFKRCKEEGRIKTYG